LTFAQIKGSKKVAAFTGAGISKAAGAQHIVVATAFLAETVIAVAS